MTKWRDLTIVAFDTETSGKYPLSAEICEIAAVKWQGGAIVDTFESLIKPSKPLVPENIAIHGITNEMVETAPPISERIADFHRFIQGAIVVAHHSPFDLGFVAHEFEKASLPLPTEDALCSSLLSRRLFPERFPAARDGNRKAGCYCCADGATPGAASTACVDGA